MLKNYVNKVFYSFYWRGTRALRREAAQLRQEAARIRQVANSLAGWMKYEGLLPDLTFDQNGDVQFITNASMHLRPGPATAHLTATFTPPASHGVINAVPGPATATSTPREPPDEHDNATR